MSLESKKIATAQAVGQSVGVTMDKTPFMQRHAGVAVLTSSTDRVVQLQESNDDQATWQNVVGVAVSSGTNRFALPSLSAAYRIDVSGGTAGTGDCEIEA